jgi:uncharacterized membrane protein YciS (DUF1049 family)
MDVINGTIHDLCNQCTHYIGTLVSVLGVIAAILGTIFAGGAFERVQQYKQKENQLKEHQESNRLRRDQLSMSSASISGSTPNSDGAAVSHDTNKKR